MSASCAEYGSRTLDHWERSEIAHQRSEKPKDRISSSIRYESRDDSARLDSLQSLSKSWHRNEDLEKGVHG